jgi:diguanylate cyclase (GGDEF)-like protein
MSERRAEAASAVGSESAGEDRPLTVLVAEDHKDLMEMLKTVLSRSRHRVVSAGDGEEAMEQLARERVDIALLDIMMPKMTAFQVCRKIREDPRLKSIYVIFLTALAGENERVKGLEAGADDYITKPFYFPELLARISVGERLTHRRWEVERQAVRDPLTGLYNRRMLEERLNDEFERAKRYQRPLSLLMIDIDNLKLVNDVYGHDWGDAVLQKIAQRLREKTRKSDIPVRYGGDEFVMVLPETPLQGALQAADKIRQEAKSLVFDPQSSAPFSVTVSIGAASTSEKMYAHWREILKAADVAVYGAKTTGKDSVKAALDWQVQRHDGLLTKG